MDIKYNAQIADCAIDENLHRLINQIYKLLPNREEGLEWEKPLETIIEELQGMNRILIGKDTYLFPILCKLEGLLELKDEEEFGLYRRTIFECLSLISELKESCRAQII